MANTLHVGGKGLNVGFTVFFFSEEESDGRSDEEEDDESESEIEDSDEHGGASLAAMVTKLRNEGRQFDFFVFLFVFPT